jgi:hypothetical protein
MCEGSGDVEIVVLDRHLPQWSVDSVKNFPGCTGIVSTDSFIE